MIPVIVKVISYDKERNICKAELQNGNFIDFDPFVGCAIELSDDDYFQGKGNDVVGNTYCMTCYTVYADSVVPHEDGLKLIC